MPHKIGYRSPPLGASASDWRTSVSNDLRAHQDNGYLSILGNPYKSIHTVNESYEEYTGPLVFPRKLEVSKVEIEELDSDLASGARVRRMDEIEMDTSIFAHPHDIYYNKQLSCAEKSKDGCRIISFESLVRWEDLPNHQYAPWQVFYSYGVSIIASWTCVEKVDKKFRCTQKFKIKIEKSITVPYIQLYCNVLRLKYTENYFKSGDVITVFIRDKNSPMQPNPPVLTIVPKGVWSEQTYVHLQPKQRLQIVTNSNETDIDFTHTDALIHLGTDKVYNPQCTALKSRTIRADFFECAKQVRAAECIFINFPQIKQWKAIIVPFMSRKDSRYPVIVDPGQTTNICANNIDGFILRSYNHMSITIGKNCPVTIDYESASVDCYEAKININEFHPYFVLDRYEKSWTVRI